MNRRLFLKTATVDAAALAGGVISFIATASARSETKGIRLKNWVWIGIDTEKPCDEWKRSFAAMRESGIRAILLSRSCGSCKR